MTMHDYYITINDMIGHHMIRGGGGEETQYIREGEVQGGLS